MFSPSTLHLAEPKLFQLQNSRDCQKWNPKITKNVTLSSLCSFALFWTNKIFSCQRAREQALSKLNSDGEQDQATGNLDFGSGVTTGPEILRKEVIQPQVPLRLPCYDFTPIIDHTLGACLLAVSAATSGTADFHGVTGGVYKARERIHRGVLIRDY